MILKRDYGNKIVFDEILSAEYHKQGKNMLIKLADGAEIMVDAKLPIDMKIIDSDTILWDRPKENEA